MSDPTTAIRTALLGRLRGLDPLIRTYVEVPSTRIYPYVAVGPIQVVPDEDACTNASESFVQLDVWSEKLDHSETAALVARIRNTLRTDLALTGHVVVDQELQDTRYTTDPAGLKAHAVMTLRIASEPAS